MNLVAKIDGNKKSPNSSIQCIYSSIVPFFYLPLIHLLQIFSYLDFGPIFIYLWWSGEPGMLASFSVFFFQERDSGIHIFPALSLFRTNFLMAGSWSEMNLNFLVKHQDHKIMNIEKINLRKEVWMGVKRKKK